MIRMGLEDKRGKQRRVDRAAASGTVFEDRHVVDLHQGTSLVNDRDRALNADIDPTMQGHGAIPASASRAAPVAVAGPPHRGLSSCSPCSRPAKDGELIGCSREILKRAALRAVQRLDEMRRNGERFGRGRI
jgi:hypothetical protein